MTQTHYFSWVQMYVDVIKISRELPCFHVRSRGFLNLPSNVSERKTKRRLFVLKFYSTQEPNVYCFIWMSFVEINGKANIR
jgi:hypothetical protein